MSIGIGLNELELVIYLIFVYHSNSSLQRGNLVNGCLGGPIPGYKRRHLPTRKA